MTNDARLEEARANLFRCTDRRDGGVWKCREIDDAGRWCDGCLLSYEMDVLSVKVGSVRRLYDLWSAEGEARGREDRLYTNGVVGMLMHALATPARRQDFVK